MGVTTDLYSYSYCIQYWILLLLQVILITYAGLAIATIDNRDSLPDLPEDDNNEQYDYEDDRSAVIFERFLIIFVLSCSLLCTVGALICDLPCLVGHFVTNKVMNHSIFRVLVSHAISYKLITSYRQQRCWPVFCM